MKNKLIGILSLIVFSIGMSSINHAQNTSARVEYSLWAKVLKAYVNDQGKVDYKGLIENRAEFDQFIKQIEGADISSMSAVEKKNFWINAYNAITLKVIMDNYPTKSIRHINFGLVWKVPRKAAGEKYSLGHIEHKILRPLGDPRIHFAINCASIGCPKLPNKPFYSRQLDKQLDDEAKRFILDLKKVKLDRENNILYYSEIFDWFEEDFLAVNDSILSYIKKYINPSDKEYLENHDVSLKAFKYDWDLNEQLKEKKGS